MIKSENFVNDTRIDFMVVCPLLPLSFSCLMCGNLLIDNSIHKVNFKAFGETENLKPFMNKFTKQSKKLFFSSAKPDV